MSYFFIKKYRAVFIASILFIALTSILYINAHAADVSDYYNESLKFDSDGTLRMTTHDKKATSNITYQTLGFVIKRYNAPIDEPGQQYAVIKLKSYSDISYREDPTDDKYIYCYYYCDKTEIMNAIEKASKAWKNQLLNYGDYVYIDEVITVCQKGVPLGSLTSNSSNCIKSTGEVYYTFETISVARHWASPESLLSHYNKRVSFPAQVSVPNFSQKAQVVNTLRYKNTKSISTIIGHNKYNKELYLANRAVPSSEPLYVRASVKNAIYNMSFDLYRGSGNFPVKVITPYKLIWTDSSGTYHSETKKVTRYYNITREFSYYTINDFLYYYLDNITVKNGALPSSICKFNGSQPKITKTSYGSYSNHVSISKYTQSITTDTVTVNSKNKLRPAIPNENYESKAQECVGNYSAKNDCLIIDGRAILFDGLTSINAPVPTEPLDEISNYTRTNLYIPDDTPNNAYLSTSTATYKLYADDSNIITLNDKNVNRVTIHTPVVCDMEFSTNSSLNQQVDSTCSENTAIIGVPFHITPSATGTHISELGYMYGDYSKYVKKSKICFPFDVYLNNRLINAGTWFEFDKSDEFVIPVGTNEGTYEISATNYAINSKDNPIIYEYSNTDINSSAAISIRTLNVAGRLYGFTAKDNGNLYHVGNKDEFGNPTTNTNVMAMEIDNGSIDLSVTNVGDTSSNSYVKIDLSYKLFCDGQYVPVTIYRKASGQDYYFPIDDSVFLSGSSAKPIGDSFAYTTGNSIAALNGAQIYSETLDLTGSLAVLPKGKYKSYLTPAEVKQIKLNGDYLVINADIGFYYNNSLVRTYTHGLCNMWSLEGYDYKDGFFDGDFLIKRFTPSKKEPTKFYVIGTH